MAFDMTEVRLLAVPLENDYKHTLDFSGPSSQQAYFIGQTKFQETDFTYQRKDNLIRYPVDYDELVQEGVNYVMYKNTSSTTKWYYAFITNMEYANAGVTFIHIQTDVIQTWLFDYVVQPSFIEREHCLRDDVGAHTIEEGVETGEYISNLQSYAMGGYDLQIVIAVTKRPDGTNSVGALYNGIYSGLEYYAFPANETLAVNDFIAQYDGDPSAESIVCMFIAPSWLISTYENTNRVISSSQPYTVGINSVSTGEIGKVLSTETLEGYNPRNKKLLCYPYRYLLCDNNSGGSVVYKYEQFKESGEIINPRFDIKGVLTPGCSCRLIPLMYKGAERNDAEGLNMGKFPALNWTSDVFTNWLTQNAVNLAFDLVTAGVSTVAGVAGMAATGGASSAMAASGAEQIGRTIAQIHQASLMPPQSKGNTNSGDVMTATRKNDFAFYEMSIKREYAQIIDGYFDMYGYKCHQVKLPNYDHRENWWYIKTIDVNIEGNIPMDDLQIIRNCYNNGITFWKNPLYIGDYGQSNNCTWGD